MQVCWWRCLLNLFFSVWQFRQFGAFARKNIYQSESVSPDKRRLPVFPSHFVTNILSHDEHTFKDEHELKTFWKKFQTHLLLKVMWLSVLAIVLSVYRIVTKSTYVVPVPQTSGSFRVQLLRPGLCYRSPSNFGWLELESETKKFRCC